MSSVRWPSAPVLAGPGGCRRGTTWSGSARLSSSRGVLRRAAPPGRPRSGGRRSAGSRRGPGGRGPAGRAPRRGSAGRSAPGRRAASRRVASHEYDSTTFEAMSVFSRSKAARWRSGDEHLGPQPARTGPGRCCRPGVVRTRACSTTDGRWTVADVVRPSRRPGGRSRSRRWSSSSSGGAAGQQAVDLEHGLGLGVGAVQLDVAEGPLGVAPLLLQPGRPAGLRRPAGAALARARSARSMTLTARCELALDPAPARERPLGHDDGLALGVVQRVRRRTSSARGRPGGGSAAGWPTPEATWYDLRPGRLRAAGGGVDDGGHDQVDGDDVDHALGDAGELLQQAAGVADDHRLGHAEAPDPARAGARRGPTR